MKKILLILISILFLAFKIGDIKVEYCVPAFAISICSNDLDLDGDNDIIVGHVYNFQTSWGGISILKNDGSGYFDLPDSIYLYGGQTNIRTANLNNDEFPEIVGITSTGNVINAAVLTYQNGNYNINTYPLEQDLDCYTVGDINNDSHLDIVFSAGTEQYWGVIYNDGDGNFSLPQTFNVSNSFPNRIVCRDLNSDNNDDIVMTGGIVKIWFNYYPDNFEIVNTNAYADRLKIIDFDNDGDNDLVGYTSFTWGDYTNISFIENLVDTINTIGPIVIDHKSTGNITVSDFNNDSLPDILLTKMDMTGLQLLTNKGNFELSIPKSISILNIGEPSRRTAVNDFDGNGYNDIAIIRCGGDPFQPNVSILYNSGFGDFEENPITLIKNQNSNCKEIMSCFPNPFTAQTKIYYIVEKKSFITINVYNTSGNLIHTIENSTRTKGEYYVNFDSSDLRSGIYYLSIYINGTKSETKKILKV